MGMVFVYKVWEAAAGAIVDKVRFATVDAYIAAQPEHVADVLERVRRGVRKTLPDAEEVIAYNLPTYKMRGKAVLHFAAWKRHWSVYPASAELVAALKHELGAAVVEKNTLRFSYADAVPVKLIEKIARFRVVEVEDRKARKRVPG
jgi:uncharacterized protein YdhG (YjbR/CyaY superfamily)